MNNFDQAVREVLGTGLESSVVQTVQVNLGLLCNLSCRHCHVEASPRRTENMTWETMQSLLRLTEALPKARVDLTGGAPELNPNFRPLLDALLEQGHQVQVRTNLTVFFEAGQGDTPEFLAERGVQLVASLPCYLDDNVDKQRGGGVYKRSVAALRRLNSLGYGRQPKLPLNLVYNPGGAFLPPDQATLEDAYRRELRERFDIEFTRLLDNYQHADGALPERPAEGWPGRALQTPVGRQFQPVNHRWPDVSSPDLYCMGRDTFRL